MIDWHSHTTWSDGRASLETMTRSAARRGVLLGVSDHALKDNGRLATPRAVAQYQEALARAPEAPVLRGAEVSLGDLGWHSDPGDLFAALDYLILAVHELSVPDGPQGRSSVKVSLTKYLNYRAGLYSTYHVTRHDRGAYFDTLLGALYASARRWEHPTTILGHFALLPEHAGGDGQSQAQREPDGVAGQFVAQVLRACRDLNIAVEINAKSRAPQPWIVEMGHQLGVRFALGSDAHLARHAGHLAYPLLLVERFGIPPERILGLGDVQRVVEVGAA